MPNLIRLVPHGEEVCEECEHSLENHCSSCWEVGNFCHCEICCCEICDFNEIKKPCFIKSKFETELLEKVPSKVNGE
jgi:hypothetical protein